MIGMTAQADASAQYPPETSPVDRALGDLRHAVGQYGALLDALSERFSSVLAESKPEPSDKLDGGVAPGRGTSALVTNLEVERDRILNYNGVLNRILVRAEIGDSDTATVR